MSRRSAHHRRRERQRERCAQQVQQREVEHQAWLAEPAKPLSSQPNRWSGTLRGGAQLAITFSGGRVPFDPADENAASRIEADTLGMMLAQARRDDEQ